MSSLYRFLLPRDTIDTKLIDIYGLFPAEYVARPLVVPYAKLWPPSIITFVKKWKLQKMKPSGRRTNGRGARRHLLDLTVSVTPRTPEGVLCLMNSPLPLSAVRTPRSMCRYRDPVVVQTPCTPVDGVRRSERIAKRTPTPKRTALRTSQRQLPRRLQSPGDLTNEINRVTSQLDALAQGMRVLEAMETGITNSIARQDSEDSMKPEIQAKGKAAEKELKGKRNSSLTSLKESFQKHLKKQTAGGESSTEVTSGNKTKDDASIAMATTKMQKGQRESSFTNLKNTLQRGIWPRKGQRPATDEEQVISCHDDTSEEDNEDAPLMMQ
ncbi:uncharacterized protein LOC110985315 isoform X2 [Acanthaster planci]|uniref:Uncharacterized protein LOC110985315 isoform X2 n=1 Tax=Acanthaster planci TaxID=133434 RepID=A0A8B7ZAF3_ACAPL|nr:uncharacterized protein LOC110985315 isoform X2 [Acanthaster planci]